MRATVVIGVVLLAIGIVAVDGASATADEPCPAKGGWTRIGPPSLETWTALWPGSARPAARGFGSVAPGLTSTAEFFVSGFGAVYRTQDCGETWQRVRTGDTETTEYGMPRVFAGANGALYLLGYLWGYEAREESLALSFSPSPSLFRVSRNSGYYWEFGHHGTPASREYVHFDVLAASWSTPGLLYGWTEHGMHRGNRTGLVRSLDGGTTWELVTREGRGSPLVVDPIDGTVLISRGRTDSETGRSTLERTRVPAAAGGPSEITQLELGPGPFVGPYGAIASIAVAPDWSRVWLVAHLGEDSTQRLYIGRGAAEISELAIPWPESELIRRGVNRWLVLAASPVDPRVLFVVTPSGQLWIYRDPD